MTADEMIARLAGVCKFPLPPNLVADIRELVSRYGRLRLCVGSTASCG